MAAHTKIIDLFGIPACGKSTLAEFLSKQEKTELSIASIRDIVIEAKKNKVAFFRSISLKTLFAVIKVRFAAPFDKKRRDISLWGWIVLDILLRYAQRQTNYDLVIVDRGFIQCFVSLERGENLHKSPKFVNACSNYIGLSPVSTYFFCEIDENLAFLRMEHRNRNSGRIDIIQDDEFKLKELISENQRFKFFVELIKGKKKNIAELKMDGSVEHLAEKILSIVNDDLC